MGRLFRQGGLRSVIVALACLVIGAGAITGCANTTNDVAPATTVPAGSAPEPEKAGTLTTWAGQKATEALGSIFGSFGSEVGSGLGQAALGYLGLGSDTTSLKDVVDQLKITNELLTQIDTDLKALNESVNALNCTEATQLQNGLGAQILTKYNDYRSFLTTLLKKDSAKVKAVDLHTEIQNWADSVLSDDFRGVVDTYSKDVYTSQSEGTGTLRACLTNSVNQWAAEAKTDSVPVKGHFDSMYQLLADYFSYQTAAAATLSNAANVNATYVMNDVKYPVTNSTLGLGPEGQTSSTTKTPCQVVDGLQPSDLPNPDQYGYIQNASHKCNLILGKSYALDTLHDQMKAQIAFIGIPFSDIKLPATISGKQTTVNAFIEKTPGTGTAVLIIPSLEGAQPFFEGEDCSMTPWPGCGKFKATSQLTVKSSQSAGSNPFDIGKSSTSWRPATNGEIRNMTNKWNAGQGAGNWQKYLTSLGFADPNNQEIRKIFLAMVDGHSDGRDVQCPNSSRAIGWNCWYPTFIDTRLGSFLDFNQQYPSFGYFNGAVVDGRHQTNPQITASTDQVAGWYGSGPTDAKFFNKAVNGWYWPDDDTRRPWQTQQFVENPTTTAYQLPVIPYDQLNSKVAQVNPFNGFLTVNGALFDQYVSDRLPTFDLSD